MRRLLWALASVSILTLSAVAVFSQSEAETPKVTRFDKDVADLSAQLSVVQDPAERKLLNDKLTVAMADRDAELASRAREQAPGREAELKRLNAQAAAAAAAEDRMPSIFVPVARAGDGVISDAARPFDPAREFVSTNAWIKELGGKDVLAVYAGVSTADRSQGVIRVYRQGYQGGVSVFIGEFVPALKTGSLRIVSAKGSVLTIEPIDGGSPLVFDTSTLQFQQP